MWSNGLVIHVSDLVKEFTRAAPVSGRFTSVRRLFSPRTTTTRAVDGVTFDIDRGELVGYLGANGAGKSTTIKMLSGILVPTSGRVEVNGIVPWQNRRANAMSIGAVFGQRTQLWYDLPLRDSLELIRDLYGIPAADYREQLGQFTELLALDDFLDTPVRLLSLGQRMRGDLVAAMLHRPVVLYLDEPTVGLDVLAQRRIREFIAEQNSTEQTTVILTTHDMADVEALASRVMIIDDGRVLYDGDIPSLKQHYAPYRSLVVTPADEPGPHAFAQLPVESVQPVDGRVELRFRPDQTTAADLIVAVAQQMSIKDAVVAEPSLGDVVAELYLERS